MSYFMACDRCSKTNQRDQGSMYNLVKIDLEASEKHPQQNTYNQNETRLEFHLCPECHLYFKERIDNILKNKSDY